MNLANQIIPSELDESLDLTVKKALRKRHEEQAAKHEPSGKLSASQLGKPLLEQVLKIIGVPTKPIDDYALGLFARGDSVEKEMVELIDGDDTQVFCEYRDAIGYLDIIKDNHPIEVKSIKNSQLQYIDPTNEKKRRSADGLVRVYGGPKYSHVLQAGLYALSQGSEDFTLLYVTADDLRRVPHRIKTDTVKPEVDRIIDEVNKQLASGELPPFVAREEWQEKYPQYSNYPDWISLDPDIAMNKLKTQYPTAYEKLNKKGA